MQPLLYPQFEDENGTPIVYGEGTYNENADSYRKGRQEKQNAVSVANGELGTLTDNLDKINSDLETAGKTLEQIKGEKEAGEKAVEAVKKGCEEIAETIKNLTNKINGENGEGGLQQEITAANEQQKAAAAANENAGSIQSAVDAAYQKVQAAIESLKNLQAVSVDDSDYQQLAKAYDKAAEEYQAALEAKGISNAKLKEVEAAVERVRIAAQTKFQYRPEPGNVDRPMEEPGNEGEDSGHGDSLQESSAALDELAGSFTDTANPVVPVSNVARRSSADSVTADAMVSVSAAAGIRATAGTGRTASGTRGREQGAESTGEKLILADGEEERSAGLVDGAKGTAPADADAGEDRGARVSTIEEEATPLADLDLETKQKMSWWWLLVVAAGGTAGYEMYKHYKKKAEEEGIAG